MSNDKPYYEGFFAVRFELNGVRVAPITQEQYQTLENAVAEVNIPHNTDDAGYCMIAMLVDLPADQIAITEIRLLQAIIADIVEINRDHFQRVG